MRRNATTGGLTPERSHKAVRAVTVKQEVETRELKAEPTETVRKYTAQVKVIDPEGHEVLNLTKLAFEEDLYGRGHSTPDIREVLELLVEAAGEWSG